MGSYRRPPRVNELYHHGVMGMKWGVRKQIRRVRKLYRKNIKDQKRLGRLQNYMKRRKEHLIDPVGWALEKREDTLKDRIKKRFSDAEQLTISAADKYAVKGQKRYDSMIERIEREKLEKAYRKLTR